jgi:phospholipid/cholesterol/gamma-HCH transport system substrate-binding protein
METRASYVAIGSFVVVLILALVTFVFWLGSVSLQEQETQRYRIFFTGAVTGLQEGSAVRYRGIRVGQVTDLRIDPQNFERVQATVELDADTPIVQGSIARLEVQGITGGTFVQITGGEQGNPPVQAPEEDELPVIPSRPSQLQQVISSVPELLDKASQFLSEENAAQFNQILANLQTLTTVLAARSDSLANTLDHVETVAVNLDGLVTELRLDIATLSDSLNQTLGNVNAETEQISQDLQQVVNSLDGTINSVDALLEATRPGLEEFTGQGLYEFTLMTSELRSLAQNLSRIATRLERNPSQFLFGESGRGVSIE